MRVPSHRPHKPSGLGRVTLGGKTYYTGRWGTDAAEATYRRLVAEWLPEMSGESPTVAKIVTTMMDHAKREYPKSGRWGGEAVQYKYALACLNTTVSGRKVLRMNANQFTVGVLSAIREQMIGKGWTRGYINRQVNRIIEAFRHAAEVELVHPDVVLRLKMLKPLRRGRAGVKDNPKRKPVPSEHIDATRKRLPKRIAAIVDICLLTGMRIGEVLSMRVNTIDTSKEVWIYSLGMDHKGRNTGEEKRVFIGPKAQAVLRPYLESARATHSLTAPLWPSKSAVGILQRTGVRSEIQKACVRAGVPKWTTHQLRHNAATETFTAEAMRLAKAQLGHRSSSTTERYTADERLASELAARHG